MDDYLSECILQVDLVNIILFYLFLTYCFDFLITIFERFLFKFQLTYNVNKYKYYNLKIIKLIENACNNSWIKCEVFKISDASVLSDQLKTTLNTYMMNLTSIIKDIIMYLKIVFESFKEHIENVSNIKFITLTLLKEN